MKTGNIMIGIGAISANSYAKRKNLLLKKHQLVTDKIFDTFDKEAKAKGLTSVADTNKLWRSKYATKLEKIEKIHDERYRVLWNSYFLKNK